MPTGTQTARRRTAANGTRRTRPLRGGKPAVVAKKTPSPRSAANRNGSSKNGSGKVRRPKLDPIERDHAQRLHDLPEDFLRCRDLRHAMEPLGAFRRGMEVHRTVICVRCNTERTDVWRIDTGARERAQYKYSKGYQVQGLGPIQAFEIRREVMDRVTIFETQEDMLQAVFRRQARAKKKARK